MLWPVFDELLQLTTSEPEQLITARRVFSQLTGLVEPDHELYAERSDAFVEWFLFEQRDEAGLTRVERRLQELPHTDPHRPHLQALRSSHRSLFQVVRLVPGGLLLDDLIGGGRFSVEERRRLPGVSAGDLFEARLIPDPGPRSVLVGRCCFTHGKRQARPLRRCAAPTTSWSLATSYSLGCCACVCAAFLTGTSRRRESTPKAPDDGAARSFVQPSTYLRKNRS